jgi:hypothetical protein
MVNESVVDGSEQHACVLIGMNDAKVRSDVVLYERYLSEIVKTLRIRRSVEVFVGTIPYFEARGHLPYRRESERHRHLLNERVVAVAKRWGAVLVSLDAVDAADLSDSVHWNEQGNQKVARLFAEAILSV